MSSREVKSPSARSAQLDGLRALAALAVLVFHVWLYGPNRPPAAQQSLTDRLLFELNLGLICFFVLSGFLLYQAFARASLTAGRPVDSKQYAVRRAARILPAYYVCLIGCLLLYWLIGPNKMLPDAANLPLFALFAQNYSPDTLMGVNPVTWTLVIEASLYLVLPLIGLAAYRLGPRRIPLQVVLLVGLIGVTLIWNALVHTQDWNPIGRKVLPAYLGHFALGMLGALWFERRRKANPEPTGNKTTGGILAAGAAIVVLGAVWHEIGGTGTAYATLSGMPAAVGFALVIVAAAAGSGPSVSWLRARPLVAIGLVSYGVYLWHLPLLLVARHAGFLPDAFALRLLIVLALALLAAAASWHLVEKPLIRRFSGDRGRSRAAASSNKAYGSEELKLETQTT